MKSFDMITGRAIATLALVPLDLSALKPGHSDGISNALKAIVPAADQVSVLLGTPSIIGGRLSLFQGYEPYIQLVPTLVRSDDPSYLPLISNLLDRRGLPAVPSQFNAGAIASGTTPLDAICGRGQRYLVYSVSSENFSHPVSFSTRIQTHASGQLYDCTNMTVIPIGLDQHLSVLTTKSPLASLITILSAAFVSKTNSWAGTLQVGGLVSGFIDADPGSIAVRNSASDRALQGLVDNLCTSLANQPSPAPTPPVPPLPVRITSAAKVEKKQTQQQVEAAKAEQAAKAAMAVLVTAVQNAAKSGSAAQLTKARAALDKAIQANKLAATPAIKQNPVNFQANLTIPGGTTAEPGTTPQTNPAAAPQTVAAGAGTALVSIDVSGFVARTPPPLVCHDPRLDKSTGTAIPAGDPRWTTLH